MRFLILLGPVFGLVCSCSTLSEQFSHPNAKISPVETISTLSSGSMGQTDGHKIVSTAKKEHVKIVPCSRWEEIRECVNYHIQMAALLQAPTAFRLLNHPGAGAGSQMFSIAEADVASIPSEVEKAMSVMQRARPGGVTPLNSHILSIHQSVSAIAPQLRAEGKKVAIILATDGLPTNEQGMCNDYVREQFISSLRLLEGLPVWVVIRLCTDEDDVVSFYNELDEQLELSLEVLDDFCGEAEEVYEHNPWLNYSLPLHRLREMGYHDRLFDMLDERPFTKSELREFCCLMFGFDQMDSVPDADADWSGFLQAMDRLVNAEELQYEPMKKKPKPVICTKTLDKMYGEGSACTIM